MTDIREAFGRFRRVYLAGPIGGPAALDAIEAMMDGGVPLSCIDEVLGQKEQLVCDAIDAELDRRDAIETLEKEIVQMATQLGLQGALEALRGLKAEEIDAEIESLGEQVRLLRTIRRSLCGPDPATAKHGNRKPKPG